MSDEGLDFVADMGTHNNERRQHKVRQYVCKDGQQK